MVTLSMIRMTYTLNFLVLLLSQCNPTYGFSTTRFSLDSKKALKMNNLRVMCKTSSSSDCADEHNHHKNAIEVDRRSMMNRVLLGSSSSSALVSLFVNVETASASSGKSRTDGYAVQRTEKEWASMLSDEQYFILRRGGTESPNSSILEGEDRPGTFVCAGCKTPLFDSKAKFHSGTGWPSFATGLEGVEVEDVNPVQFNLLGAELRCATCGGHLGDVFGDGLLFVGTPAFISGKRYCIDGAALIFQPKDGSDEISGDTPNPQLKPMFNNNGELPSFLQPPEIKAR